MSGRHDAGLAAPFEVWIGDYLAGLAASARYGTRGDRHSGAGIP